MPALPPVTNCIRADIHHSVGNDVTALVRQHYRYSGGPPNASDLNTAAGTFRSSWNTNLKAFAGSYVSLTGVVLTDINSSTGAQGIDTTAVVGTRAGSELSNATSVLVNYGISRRYRGGKPRQYYPYFTASDMSAGGVWNSTNAAALQTALEAWLTAIEAISLGTLSGLVLVNVSYYSGFTVVTSPTTGRARNVPKLRSGGPVVDVINNINVNLKPGTQRRRNLHSS